MMRSLTLTGAALAMGASALLPSVADAQRYGGGYGYERAYGDAYHDGYNRGPHYYRDRGYRYEGRDYRRRCNNGTTGTIVGAIAGGLLGRSVDTRGDRTLGTVLGAGAGALAGNAVERSGNRGYCR